MILREYFGVDLPDLPNRSYDYPDNEHTYDFFDVTDQLPLPGTDPDAGTEAAGTGAAGAEAEGPSPAPEPAPEASLAPSTSASPAA